MLENPEECYRCQ